jgi:hypothetical protein
MPDRDRSTHCEGVPTVDWLAFCYMAGELSADEAAEFEVRLRDQQPAREALARAAELYWAVQAAWCDTALGGQGVVGQAADVAAEMAQPVSVPCAPARGSVPASGVASAAAGGRQSGRGRLSVRAWCGTVAAAAVAVLVFLLAVWPPADGPDGAGTTGDEQALALAWVAAGELHESSPFLEGLRADEPPGGDGLDEASHTPEPPGAEGDVVVPRWMLAAVAADEMASQ